MVALSITGLTVRYGALCALQDVALSVRGGEVLALIGPNGSGKSSLLRCLAGLQRYGGTVAAAGLDAGGIGFLPQDNGSRAALTVVETVLLGRRRALGLHVPAAELARVEAVLEQLQLRELGGRLLGELSGGQRQLVFLAQVLVAEPLLLLLDEPTSALDLRHQMQLLGLLRQLARQQGMAVVVALHDLNAAARFADRIAVLQQGRLVAAGTPAEVLTAALLRDVYGVAAEVTAGADGVPRIMALEQTSYGWD